LNVSGTVAKAAVRTLLAVIPCGKSRDHPDENALYIVQIWCPEENYERHARLMEEILFSVQIEITPNSEPARFTYRHETHPLYPSMRISTEGCTTR
jgi:hypothetical protein